MEDTNKIPDIILALNLKNEFIEFDSIKNAVKSNPNLIVKKSFSHTYTTKSTNKDYSIYDYEFYNSNGKEKLPGSNQWKIVNISKGDFLCKNRNWAPGVIVKYSDSIGIVESRIVFNERGIINYLQEFSEFNSWSSYHLNITNEELMKENNRIKKENHDFRKKVNKLRKKIKKLKKKKVKT
jgi:hypothetical protein